MKGKTSKRSTPTVLEIEAKFKVRNLGQLRRSLLEIGCKEKSPRSLEENWTWDFPNQSLRQAGKLLRVRRFAGNGLLTFKSPAQESQHFKIREERETAVRDPGVLGEILQHLGLVNMFRYEKFRTAYSLAVQSGRHRVNLVVDETPIGNYLEIEGRESDILQVAAQLGFPRNTFIKESYLALFEKSDLRRRQQHMVFPAVVKAKTRRM